jgi:hypothetical protein
VFVSVLTYIERERLLGFINSTFGGDYICSGTTTAEKKSSIEKLCLKLFVYIYPYTQAETYVAMRVLLYYIDYFRFSIT